MRWRRGWRAFRINACKAVLNSNCVGDYRVLYEFDPTLGRIYLHYVGHRREIYKRS